MGLIETHDLDSWKAFRPLVGEVREKYGHGKLGDDFTKRNLILFRGLGCSDWPLSTTLERRAPQPMTVQVYMMHASTCSAELESLSGKQWDIPDYPDIKQEIEDKQTSQHVHLPCYDYLVYLRHHGFPSPLLDWTESPYIAAYFAFCEPHQCERVAVYAYIERTKGAKDVSVGSPMISLKGNYVRTHSRHFAQKAWYTIATTYNEARKLHTFCDHSLVFGKANQNQDVLIKITMPATDRLRALAELGDYNINHFTLFQTEDALVQVLALKEFDLDQT